MSVFLGLIGLVISAYAAWMSFRIGQSIGVPQNPDILIVQFGIPGAIFIFGLLLLAAASALDFLRRIANSARNTAAILERLDSKIPPR